MAFVDVVIKLRVPSNVGEFLGHLRKNSGWLSQEQ
jgi:hypothetical protein